VSENLSARRQGFLSPTQRLICLAFLVDAGVACLMLVVQFRALQLGAPPLISGLLGTAGFLLYVPVAIAAGHLCDRLGRRPVALVSCFICLATWAFMWRATTAGQLLVLATVGGAGLGLLWPPVQAWLGDLSGDDSRLLNHNLGIFNIAWTAGLMIGPLAGGAAWEHWQVNAFLVPAGIASLSLLAVLLTPAGRHHEASDVPPPQVEPAVVRAFMLMAWCAVIATTFARGMIGAMFPRIGETLGYSPTLVGRIMFAVGAAQLIAFEAARLSSRWQYRRGPLVAMVVLTLLGQLLAQFTSSPWLFALSFFIIGGATSLTFVSGITYALHLSAEGRGLRAGIHEAVIGAGLVGGPLIGGLAAQYIDLKAPFGAGAVVCGLVLVAQLIVAPRRASRSAQKG
jgi:MFS transporter, DHA1 family, multidrug resistance protein